MALRSLFVNFRVQCDQMANLFAQFLAIYKIEKFPKSIKVAKVGSNFFRY